MTQNTAALNSGKNSSIKSQKTQVLNERSLRITASCQRNRAPDWPREQHHINYSQAASASLDSSTGVGQAAAVPALCREGGKSGLRRTGRQVMPGRREPTESATENIPPTGCHSPRVRVKWCGKSAPRFRQRKWQGKPRPEQDQIGGQRALSRTCGPHGSRVGRTRRAVRRVPDEWLSKTEPGLSADSSLFLTCSHRLSLQRIS